MSPWELITPENIKDLEGRFDILVRDSSLKSGEVVDGFLDSHGDWYSCIANRWINPTHWRLMPRFYMREGIYE